MSGALNCWRLVFSLSLFLFAIGARGDLGPQGFGRPPGFGPELDKKVIAQFRELQLFLTRDVGLVPGTSSRQPAVRDGILRRNLSLAFRLDPALARRFKEWRRALFRIQGVTALGIVPSGMDYLMSDMNADYAYHDLGDFSPFWTSSAVHAEFARQCNRLFLMAKGYIDKLENRLKHEAVLKTEKKGPDGRPLPKPPVYFFDTMPDGEKHYQEMMEERRRRKGLQEEGP